jgi:hypothetical protein
MFSLLCFQFSSLHWNHNPSTSMKTCHAHFGYPGFRPFWFYCSRTLSNISILIVPDEGYSRNVSSAINLMSTFLLRQCVEASSRYEYNQSIHPYLPHKRCTESSVLLQHTITKLAWPLYVQLDVIQFLPSAESETKLPSLKSNKNKISRNASSGLISTFIIIFLLLQKRFVRTKFNVYFFIKTICGIF